MTACAPGACDWYHGAWPHLRRLGLVTSPDWHDGFYRAAFARLAPPGAPVLIPGAADEALLALALAAGVAPEDVTVLDRCETPLLASRRLAPAVRTVRGDVRDHAAPGGGYAAIAADGFLTRLPGPERPAVVRAWRRLLRPGGAAVTTVRIGGAGSAERAAPPPEMRAERLRRAALARYEGPDAAAVGELAYAFGLRRRRHAVESVAEVTELFQAHGFAIDTADQAAVRGATFLRLIAA